MTTKFKKPIALLLAVAIAMLLNFPSGLFTSIGIGLTANAEDTLVIMSGVQRKPVPLIRPVPRADMMFINVRSVEQKKRCQMIPLRQDITKARTANVQIAVHT